MAAFKHDATAPPFVTRWSALVRVPAAAVPATHQEAGHIAEHQPRSGRRSSGLFTHKVRTEDQPSCRPRGASPRADEKGMEPQRAAPHLLAAGQFGLGSASAACLQPPRAPPAGHATTPPTWALFACAGHGGRARLGERLSHGNVLEFNVYAEQYGGVLAACHAWAIISRDEMRWCVCERRMELPG